VADAAEPLADAEHDDWAWWPADVSSWPAEADERLKVMARMISARD
jgi:8-oxo-dGTP diphosphatase